MHRCLSVDEILRLLACELVASEAKATATALACCCKTFEDPVLDVLWEAQDQLTTLLKCLPQGVWEEEDESFVSPLTVFITLAFNRLVGFQENPDESGRGPLLKVYSKNTKARNCGHRNPGRSPTPATLYHRHLLASRVQSLRVRESYDGVCPLHPPISLSQNHRY